MTDKCMKRCSHPLRVREMHIKVRYHITFLRVEDTGNRVIAAISIRKGVSSDLRHFCLWESNLVTFITD